MPTINNWNNNVLAANVTFNGGTMSIGTDSTDNAINIGTAASAGRTVTIGNATGTSTIAINCGTGGVSVGTSSNVHSSTFGSTNSTSSTTLQSGSGALSITSTNGAITMNSGTGTVSIGSDSTAATYNFSTGAGAKLVTLGTTNGASSVALKTGTADFSLSSATGTIMSALDTGEITYPLQPAFSAIGASTVTNATGNGGAYTIGSSAAMTELVDQNGDFNTNGTFTAPVTGKYFLSGGALILGTVCTGIESRINTSNGTYTSGMFRPANGTLGFETYVVGDMDAADTAILQIVGTGSASNDQSVSSGSCQFSGYLVC